MNMTYKITFNKGWYTHQCKVFKTFYFKDFAYANDFMLRLSRMQRLPDCTWGKIQMEQIINSDIEPTARRYKEYAKLVLSLGLRNMTTESDGRFARMINNIIDENSTPVIYKKFKKDFKTRIWFTDVVEKNYPRSTKFLDKQQKEKILEGA